MALNQGQPSTRLGRWLWTLTALFALRVVAQPLSLIVEHRLLPRFDAWHSEALPYSVLVASQLLILLAMSWTSHGVGNGTIARRRSMASVLMWIGAIYFGSMLARLMLGATLLGHVRWFGSWLPTLFHLILATFLWSLGRWHGDSGSGTV